MLVVAETIDTVPPDHDLQINGKEWYRDKGGRLLKGGKWRVFNFEVEVAIESPKGVDEDEAAEDAAEFMATVQRTQGRVHDSFASITRIKELPVGLALGELHRSKLEELAEKTKPKNKEIKAPEPVMETMYEDAVPYLPNPSPPDRIKVQKTKPVKAKPKKAKKI